MIFQRFFSRQIHQRHPIPKPTGLFKPIAYTIGITVTTFGVFSFLRSNRYGQHYVSTHDLQRQIMNDIRRAFPNNYEKEDLVLADKLIRSESFSLANGILFVTVLVYLAWKWKRIRKFMNKNFVHDPSSDRFSSFILSTWSHESFFHLALNMYALYSFLPILEYNGGMSMEQMLFLYISAGAFASFGSVAMTRLITSRKSIPSLGASGALFGYYINHFNF
jgi:membrane associated rhomboid family serine protease